MQSKVNANVILITFLIGSFFAILNETLLNIALTKLMDVFQVDATTVQWLVTGFMIVMGMVYDKTNVHWSNDGFLVWVSDCCLCGELPNVINWTDDSGGRNRSVDACYYECVIADLSA
jgi:hypothetical protein